MEVVLLDQSMLIVWHLRVKVFVGGEILVVIQFGGATRENVDIL